MPGSRVEARLIFRNANSTQKSGWNQKKGKHSFCQLMTASMPTFIGRNITGIRPTHDCFCANLGHIMTAFMPTLGLTA